MHNSILTYNDQAIEQRADGYVNATQMAKANNVLIADWLRLSATKAYTQELSIDTGISISELTIINKGGDSTKQGTWVHPLLALNFGRWISPKFAIWCDTHIKTLIETGETKVEANRQPITTAEAFLQTAQILVEHENRLAEQEKATEQLSARVLEIERNRLEAIASLQESERSDIPPEEMSMRSKINFLVRGYVHRNEITHQEVWNSLYLQLKYRYHFDAKKRAKNANKKAIEIVEEHGLLVELFAIASELLR